MLNPAVVEDIVENLSHDELLEITNSSISQLLQNDSLFPDIPHDASTEEIISQIAVEHGRAITVYVTRENQEVLKVVVPQTATVRVLKNAIKRHFDFYQKRVGMNTAISWKWIWRTYTLNYDSIILDDNNALIKDYGVTNKVSLTFKKKRSNKNKPNP